MLNHPQKEMSCAGLWIQESKTLLHSFTSFKVSWVRRSANIVAHRLAKLSVGDELCKV
mgnify:CR=1 FL=1